MCKLAFALGVVIANEGFPGLGFKAAATLSGTPRSSMRYALQAWKHGMAFAVATGVISDQRTVGILAGLPQAVIDTICRVESKLGRVLTRARAEQLAWNWRVVRIKRVIAGMPVLDRFTQCIPVEVISVHRIEEVVK